MIFVFSRWSRGFSISSKWWLLRVGINGWWSVNTVNWGRPARNILHLVIAHVTASNSTSMMAYQDSESDGNREPAFISAHLSPWHCWRMNPRPCVLASVLKRVDFLWSIKDKVGADANDCLAVQKAWSWLDDHMNSFFVLSSGCNGLSRPTTESVLTASWLASRKRHADLCN